MSNPDILFRGIPRSKTRGYTARVLSAVKPRKVVIPCTGSFSLAWVAREAGVPADTIVCGDISLYSTAGDDPAPQWGSPWRSVFADRPNSMGQAAINWIIANRDPIGIEASRGKVIKKGDKVLEHCASVAFAFTAPHPRYNRLHKLTLMSITSEWFWDDVLGKENWYELNGAPKHVKTTMHTHHPEVKSARGVFKLDTREAQKDGTYKLTYSTATNTRTREGTLNEWLKKFADVQKDGS